MDKELEALQLRVQALELELQNNRNFVNAMSSFVTACELVTNEHDDRLKRLERVTAPKIIEQA